MRMYEATGMGACLVTDWKSNLQELFEPEVEVVTYRSAAECVEKVDWLLAHPSEIVRIGEAGRRRTLRSHTYNHRAPLLDEIMRSHMR
jgi:spore maturation protein CgeB